MDCVNSFQHIFPIALSFQWIHLFFLFKPAIEINISTLHYHVDMLISNFTKNKTCMLKVKEISFYREILIANSIYSLAIKADDLITMLLQFTQMSNFILIALNSLLISFL